MEIGRCRNGDAMGLVSYELKFETLLFVLRERGVGWDGSMGLNSGAPNLHSSHQLSHKRATHRDMAVRFHLISCAYCML